MALTKIPNSMLLTAGGGGGGSAGVVVVAGFTMTEINAALASAGANGHVFFPNGTYTVAGLTASYANQTWEFARNAKLIKAAANTAAMIVLSASGLTILGGDFDCNRAAAPAATVFVDGTNMDFTMIGAKVHGGTSWGVAIDNGLVRVEDCYFYNFAYAVLIWRATSKNGADFRLGPTVKNNFIDRRTGYTASCGLIMRSVGVGILYQAALAHGNRILMPSDGDDTYDNVGIEMTESVFSKMTDNHVEGSRIAYSFGGSQRGVVANNTAVAVGDYMIEIASACSNMAVTGNTGTGLSIGNPGTGGCVITSGGSGNLVVGNRIGQGFPTPVYQDAPSASASPANLIASNA
ncbi:right-handed parallel beta-helix repeat-containing protein [Rhizobium leguminosarum]|uniref:right-handed parallel beta-helix repeat-containing protein n=1 Tax=Rhizobium leguminosarum TaxID=384 RepID=UPI001A913D07|nr:right-handed parallel beta-helix repeat-containing protein [Rhizobium leguminosarum]MBY5553714.1 hypothetical protein [Rhizobium leguminosarum]QSW24872.1 right-handed parallel beta-helix repeat-containing protein [Rhizobium leguminosarum]